MCEKEEEGGRERRERKGKAGRGGGSCLGSGEKMARTPAEGVYRS